VIDKKGLISNYTHPRSQAHLMGHLLSRPWQKQPKSRMPKKPSLKRQGKTKKQKDLLKWHKKRLEAIYLPERINPTWMYFIPQTKYGKSLLFWDWQIAISLHMDPMQHSLRYLHLY
jgi:hypothetical protein